MTSAGAFIGGAKGRLLPASIPLRFFGAAVVAHLLAWLALAAGAAPWPSFGGGLGWPLAALHLVTLGVLATSALGAGAQLLPVATRQPAPSPRLLALVWWLHVPGVAVLALGMGMGQPPLLAAGAVAVTLALALWGLLMARHLRGAHGMPGVVAHGWAALGALAGVLATALSLAAAWLGWPAPDRDTALALHLVLGPYGFMGLLSLGLSYILVPMFALADVPDERRQQLSGALAVAALVLAGLAAAGIAAQPLRLAALAAGAAAVGLHLRLMASALRSGMRPVLGRSLRLLQLGWAGLCASLALALALTLLAPAPRLATAFGLCLVGVWLLSFLLGMLQRILPFLAAMHGGPGRRTPTPSALTHEPALRVHFVCHLAALALLAAAIVADSRWITLAGAAVGSAGALAYCLFYAVLLRRMRPRP